MRKNFRFRRGIENKNFFCSPGGEGGVLLLDGLPALGDAVADDGAVHGLGGGAGDLHDGGLLLGGAAVADEHLGDLVLLVEDLKGHEVTGGGRSDGHGGEGEQGELEGGRTG